MAKQKWSVRKKAIKQLLDSAKLRYEQLPTFSGKQLVDSLQAKFNAE